MATIQEVNTANNSREESLTVAASGPVAWGDALSPGDPTNVVARPASDGLPTTTEFTCTVSGATLTDVVCPIYGMRVALDFCYVALPTAINNEIAGFTSFDMTGACTAKVTVSGRTVTSAKVLPTSYGITPTVAGQVITLALPRWGIYEVQVNGSETRPFYIFANQPEIDPPVAGSGVTIYNAGIHTPGVVTLSSNQTAYIKAGAVVKGRFVSSDTTNVKVRGRGVLYCAQFTDVNNDHAISFGGTDGTTLEGIVILDSIGWSLDHWQCSNLTIDNVKHIAYRQNSDGAGGMGWRAAVVRNSFFRNWDDGVVLKSQGRSATNIRVYGNRMDCDLGGGCYKFGTELSYKIDDVVFENTDMCHAHARWPMAIEIAVGTGGSVDNVTFRNIRVEAHHGHSCDPASNDWVYLDAQTGPITRILFDNITLTGDASLGARLIATSSTNRIDDVEFRNVYLNGVKVTSDSQWGLTRTSFVTNVRYT